MGFLAQPPGRAEKPLHFFVMKQMAETAELLKLCRERARQYWFMARRAPLLFIVTFLLGLGLANWWSGKEMGALKQKHNADIQSYNAQISWLQQRLFTKDDLLNQYRERLDVGRLTGQACDQN